MIRDQKNHLRVSELLGSRFSVSLRVHLIKGGQVAMMLKRSKRCLFLSHSDKQEVPSGGAGAGPALAKRSFFALVRECASIM